MSDYEHSPKNRIHYSKDVPPCPKCGSTWIKRLYQCHSQGYGTPYSSLDWDGKEFLEVICQSCGYSFPQDVKYVKLKHEDSKGLKKS